VVEHAVRVTGLGNGFDCGEFELFGAVFIEKRLEMHAASGFIESSSADDDELLAVAETLSVDGGSSANHANGEELGDFVGQGHKDGDGAEGLVGEGGIEAGEDDALAEVNEFHGEVGDAGVEKLDLVKANDVDVMDAAGCEELGFEAFGGWCNYRCIMGLGAMTGDGGAVIAEVDVGLEAGDALAGDAGSLKAAD
jgi:hypothetical protein